MDRALIIKKEHLDRIFDNKKIWEMRSTETNVRGIIGLIEAGSGLIMGEANLLGNGMPLNLVTATIHAEHHQVADLSLLEKWKYPWILEGAKRYEKPVPYDHPAGAVIWVKIDGQ